MNWRSAGEVLGEALDDAMAALQAVTSEGAETSSSYASHEDTHDDGPQDTHDDAEDTNDDDASWQEPESPSAGGALGGVAAMLSGASTGGSQNSGDTPLGGLAGGLMAGLAQMNGSAIRDAPIPTDAAGPKRDFVQTLAKVGTFWSGGGNYVKQAAKDRLGALLTTWRMSHTGEDDYDVTLKSFEAEIAKIDAERKKNMLIMAIAFVGFCVLLPFILKAP